MTRWLRTDPLRAALTLIAVITAITGAVQVLVPGLVLAALGAESSSGTRQLIGTVGMFMIVIGGLLTHTLVMPSPDRAVVIWSAGQKLGAFIAVTIGVLTATFGTVALSVGLFDLLTSGLLLMEWRRLRRPAPTLEVR